MTAKALKRQITTRRQASTKNLALMMQVQRGQSSQTLAATTERIQTIRIPLILPVGLCLCFLGLLSVSDGFILSVKSRNQIQGGKCVISGNEKTEISYQCNNQRGSFPSTSLCNDLSNSEEEPSSFRFLKRVDGLLHAILVRDETSVWTWLQEQQTQMHNDFLRDRSRFAWLTESETASTHQNLPKNDWILVNNRPLAVRTLEPVLDESTTDLLKAVANEYFSSKKDQSSFTYQRKGNSEAHLGDLCAANETLKMAIQQALQTKIFPLVQDRFLLQDWNLYIYDSLYIRYNATAASDAIMLGDSMVQKLGAGQPLHRDMGVVSVNIMLNDAEEFQGGGTFFEEQLSGLDRTTNRTPIKPLRPGDRRGHALVHYSNHRHAGAGTIHGARDILVMFLSASSKTSNQDDKTQMHPIEFAARVKEKSKALSTVSSSNDPFYFNCKRAMLYRTALSQVPTDGDAFHYLGTCLHALAQVLLQNNKVDQAFLANQLSMEALIDHAVRLCPNDGRLYNNIGLILGNQYGEARDEKKIEYVYRTSLELHECSKAVGCDVQTDIESTALNYGLFLSYQDRWQDAIDVLDHINDLQIGSLSSSSDNEESLRMEKLRDDAYKLRQFCAKQLELQTSSESASIS